jgi:hypothetical protein
MFSLVSSTIQSYSILNIFLRMNDDQNLKKSTSYNLNLDNWSILILLKF